MNHPVTIVTIRIIIPGVRAAAFGSSAGAVDRHLSLCEQIFEFECLDQVRVPDEGSISYPNICKHPRSLVDLNDALVQDLFVSENSTVRLHHSLHAQADGCGACWTFGKTNSIKPRENIVYGRPVALQGSVGGLHSLGSTLSGRAAEND